MVRTKPGRARRRGTARPEGADDNGTLGRLTPHRAGRAVALALVAALTACAGTSHAVRRPERRARAVVRPPTTRAAPTTASTASTTTTTRAPLSAAQRTALAIGLAPPHVAGVFALGDSVMLGA